MQVKDAKRISQVARVLFKHGWGYIIEELGLKFHLPLFHKVMKHKFRAPANPQERIVPILEELGGTYIKLGQLLSIRPDLMHLDVCKECQRLQDNVKPFSFDEARSLIEQEFHKPIKKIFKSFNEKPIAAASIGQVHEARLKDGTRVAVKVQRPHIKEIMEADIDVMEYFASQMEKHSRFRKYRPRLIIDEFKRYTKNELDYIQEAHNAERFYNNFKDSKKIKIPKVYWDYTTDKVLTLEFIDGTKLKDIKAREPEKERIIKYGLEAEFKQIFEDGFFHADLHPGNILLMKDKTIVFLDFGIVGTITPTMQRHSVELFLALMRKDSSAVGRILIKVGSIGRDTNKEKFLKDVESTVNTWYGKRLSEERVTHMLHLLFNVCADNDIRVPIELVLLGKALVTIEGTCQQLEPHFDLAKYSEPYLEKIMHQQTDFELHQVRDYYKRLRGAMIDLPERLEGILNSLKEPKIKVDIDDTDIKTLGLEIDRSSNRLSYGILISALIISGAMMAPMKVGFEIWGLSFISVLCFCAAAGLGIILLYSVLTEGK